MWLGSWQKVVEPFIDYQDKWVVRYFGRISIDDSYIDVVASDSLNSENHKYDEVFLNGEKIQIETFENRYQLELSRNRLERIKAMEEYRNKIGGKLTKNN